ncbi:MAG: acylphosphatase, partial [Deinococcales bacterium]
MPTSTSGSRPAPRPRADAFGGSGSAETGRLRLRVRGVVQGVGFRPFVYRLAHRLRLRGWVLNDGDGVLIEASGSGAALDALSPALISECPPAGRVDAIVELARGPADAIADGFVIHDSPQGGDITTLISPDLAVCDDCLRELNDPSDRRYGYPYINCTHCGPRYSII